MLELMEVMRKIEMLFMHAARPHISEYGLGKTDIVVLMTVYNRKSLRISDLAKMADVPSSTFTGVIDRLVQKDYLVRISDPSDRRSIRIEGTQKMRDIIEALMAKFNDVMAEILKPVPETLIECTAENLNRIYEIISAKTGEQPDPRMHESEN